VNVDPKLIEEMRQRLDGAGVMFIASPEFLADVALAASWYQFSERRAGEGAVAIPLSSARELLSRMEENFINEFCRALNQ
jgi:hypothetical protein